MNIHQLTSSKNRTLITIVRNVALSIQEAFVYLLMILYKVTITENLNQYIAAKPENVLSNFLHLLVLMNDGIIHHEFPYQGSASFDNKIENEKQINLKEEQINLSYKVVISVAKSMTRHERSITYASNYWLQLGQTSDLVSCLFVYWYC